MAARARELETAGFQLSIAAAGGSAHLPGMTASETLLPVIGIPVATIHLKGLDSLHSIIQMPEGVPVGTVGVGQAEQAALLAAQIVGLDDPALRGRVRARRGLHPSVPPAREFVALIGFKAETACHAAIALLAELGIKDCAAFDVGALADVERAGARTIIVWAEGDDLSLPGEISAHTDIPVIGVPLMPGAAPSDLFTRLFGKGPVAGMGINRVRNAALFAARIVGIQVSRVRERLRAWRDRAAEEVEKKDARLTTLGIRKYLDSR
jgi:5-(carboxyamino)imidazole ribonucleotide mutase